jgi:hypothetical protein
LGQTLHSYELRYEAASVADLYSKQQEKSSMLIESSFVASGFGKDGMQTDWD